MQPNSVCRVVKNICSLAIVDFVPRPVRLAAFTTERRQRDRYPKILGSPSASIVYLLSVEFTKMILAAIAVALPVSYFLADMWLKNFVFRIDLQWWFFAASALAALVIAWLTVGIHTMKAAGVNPAKCLRSE